MLKTKIQKIYDRIMLSSQEPMFFGKLFKKLFLSFSNWYLFTEFRKGFLLPKLIKENILLFLLVSISVVWTVGFFYLGRASNFKQVGNLENKLSKTTYQLEATHKILGERESTIDRIRREVGEREYLQFIIKRDCHLRNFDGLTKLPDEVFFTMIDEIETHNVPYTIFFRVIDRESGFTFIENPSSGAFGYCQVLPSTFRVAQREIGVKDHNEINNIKVGVWVLKGGYLRHKRKGLTDEKAWHNSLVDYSGGSHELAKEEMKYYKKGLNETSNIVHKFEKKELGT